MELVLQLRDLVHDHLRPGRLLHHLRPGLQQRRADRHLLGLADHLRAHPHGCLLDVGAVLGLPHCRRPLLVGGQAGRSGLVVVHRLVQRDRPDRRGRLRGLRLRDLRGEPVQPLGPQHPRQLHRHARARRDLRAVPDHHGPARADQHLLVAPGRPVQQHLGVRPRGRRGDHHPDPDHRAGPPPERGLRLHRHDQQLGLLGRIELEPLLLVLRAARRLPADYVHGHRLRRLGPRVRGDARTPRSRRPRACGSRCSSRR